MNAAMEDMVQVTRMFLTRRAFSSRVEFETPAFGDVAYIERVGVMYAPENYEVCARVMVGNEFAAVMMLNGKTVNRNHVMHDIPRQVDGRGWREFCPQQGLVIRGVKVPALMPFAIELDGKTAPPVGMYVRLQCVLFHAVPTTPEGATVLE